jgi:hypothetical protein
MHHKLGKLPESDVLVHGGDVSNIGGKTDVENFLQWFCNQPHPHKIFIAGNHDRSFDPKFNFEPSIDWDRPNRNKQSWLSAYLRTLPSNVHYLEDNGIEINGIKFWGSPWTPWFHGTSWAFNKHRGSEIKEIWDTIPQGTDVVITHGPVSYKLDYVPHSDEYVGCNDLLYKIQEIKPLLHISGHIHEGYGFTYDGETTYINASSVNFNYVIANKPWVVEITKDREIKIQDNS